MKEEMKVIKVEVLNPINIPGTKIASDTTIDPSNKHQGVSLSLHGNYLRVDGGKFPVLIPASNLKVIFIDLKN